MNDTLQCAALRAVLAELVAATFHMRDHASNTGERFPDAHAAARHALKATEGAQSNVPELYAAWLESRVAAPYVDATTREWVQRQLGNVRKAAAIL